MIRIFFSYPRFVKNTWTELLERFVIEKSDYYQPENGKAFCRPLEKDVVVAALQTLYGKVQVKVF